MSLKISVALRRQVASRAHGLCEYCLVHQRDSYFGHQVDHVIARKHGGLSVSENLAFSCLPCNIAKGSDIGSVSPPPRKYIRFFHPREDRWAEHFTIHGALIQPVTEIGQVTVRLLAFNEKERVAERHVFIRDGKYPSIEAIAHIREP